MDAYGYNSDAERRRRDLTAAQVIAEAERKASPSYGAAIGASVVVALSFAGLAALLLEALK